MRIVVATLYEAVGGSTKVLLAAADALRQNHAVTVRAPLPGADSVMPRAVSARALDTGIRKLAILPALAGAFFRELKWLVRNRPDVIYVHDVLALYVYGLLGRILGLRLVWHVHMQEGSCLVRRFRDALCDAKLFVANFMVGEDQRKPWQVIRNPTAAGAGGPAKPRGVLNVGMVGSISALKNQALGIRTIAAMRDRGQPGRLLIFGETRDRKYRAQIDALIKRLGVEDAVSFRGFVPSERALPEIDVLLMCSTYESFGLAVIEALAAGIPVAASDIDGHREIALILRTHALALSALDPGAMADAILSVRRDPTSPSRVATEFGPQRFCSELNAFFLDFASKPQPSRPVTTL